MLPLVTMWMDLEGIMLSKISQTEKGKYPIVTCRTQNLKDINMQSRKRLTDTENRLMTARGEGDKGDRRQRCRGTETIIVR